ncbi:hypothetical protein [Paraburkholderia sp. MM5482-R1]|uniref:hypothetical protein n=1 Tax=unclassified Paraburkholderia TaxID=2615204 RepID=UPI003D248047
MSDTFQMALRALFQTYGDTHAPARRMGDQLGYAAIELQRVAQAADPVGHRLGMHGARVRAVGCAGHRDERMGLDYNASRDQRSRILRNPRSRSPQCAR